ncbi:hypothetical protein PR202_gb21468 [Eleusine coracana subsp. coracana]|uniref:Uncharacterized protein n=1 Tax=Eleusine coracana subsp. coracana TaxID=191504 RepID=A0AAV5FFA6_ELECO|nr:hypothetical protein QOZ80_7BG0606330 [Eleusine coracana subsp. coracana]GJN32925.1 hypothetical protein PR202_gb21468 [Eleusine coracana subsp. coracana]
MDTLFRLVSLHASSSEQPPQQQSPSYNSRSTTSSGSRSSSHQTNASYNYYTSSGGGGGQYSYYGHHQQQQQPYYLEPYQEECHHLYMDEDFSSSSSSRHHHHLHSSHGGGGATPPTSSAATTTPLSTTSSTAAAHHHQHDLFEPADLSYPPDLNLDFSSPAPSSSSGGGGTGGGASSVVGVAGGGGRWGSQLLLECARAVAGRDSSRVQQLMWMLNELASPYGDLDQKLASYFLQGLFARLTSSGPRTLRTLAAASDRNASFDSTRRTALRFQELSPWSSFGHVAANGAILESFLEAAASSSSEQQPARLHILDLSNTFCTQWPTLLEALATRSADDTPHLSITTVVQHQHQHQQQHQQQRVMREIGQRMERFARLMGVPFTFRAVHHAGDLADLDLDSLIRDHHHAGAGPTTALAVNCVNALRGVAGGARRRDAFVESIRRLDPRVVTVVEEEADLVVDSESDDTDDQAAFLKVFGEGLRFFAAYMDSLEESFPRTSNERLALERGAGRAIVDLVACPASESVERRETAAAWARRMRGAGFAPVAFSEDVADDVRSLLRRYREGWSMREAGGAVDDSSAGGGAGAGLFLAWKEQPLVWASAWRP